MIYSDTNLWEFPAVLSNQRWAIIGFIQSWYFARNWTGGYWGKERGWNDKGFELDFQESQDKWGLKRREKQMLVSWTSRVTSLVYLWGMNVHNGSHGKCSSTFCRLFIFHSLLPINHSTPLGLASLSLERAVKTRWSAELSQGVPQTRPFHRFLVSENQHNSQLFRVFLNLPLVLTKSIAKCGEALQMSMHYSLPPQICP